ncbi:hypothetical protein [Labilibaculum euxinus]
MFRKNKMAAFTLVEIIMVMVLTVLVIGIILLGFRHFQQYRAMQERNAGKLSEVLLVQGALTNWFQKAHTIQMLDEVLVFKDSIVIGVCVLEEERLLLQKRDVRDTFLFKPRNVRVINEDGLPWVKELYFEIGEEGMNNSFLFRKEYGKAILFNWEEKNHEH